MRKLTTAFIASALVLLASPAAHAHAENLKLLWETDGFKNPESVVYDSRLDRLYVSNVNGAPTEKNGQGFISIVSMDGTIETLEWVDGLDAPKGLALHGDRLYVADIDTLAVIDIDTGRVINRYTVDDAEFLNDVAAALNGDIYVSDMVKNRIHRLREDRFTIWLENEELENPNGVLVQEDRLVIGAWGVMTEGFETETPGHLKAVSLKDKTIRSIGEGQPIGNLDGVETDLDGDFYATDWMAGKLLHIEPDGTAETLLDLNQGSADHEYIHEQDIILIPMMNDGKLFAYKAHAGEDDAL